MSEPAAPTVDIVTVAHNEQRMVDANRLFDQVAEHHDPTTFTFTIWDNRVDNLGFANGCNAGASRGAAPIIGFLNPDANVDGPFLPAVVEALRQPLVVITGCRFGKPRAELDLWGCRDWVCGAAFFVTRSWWETMGGFDTRYRWGWEETDLIRRAQADHKVVRSIDLPIRHASPSDDTPEDVAYKQHWFDEGARLFNRRWR